MITLSVEKRSSDSAKATALRRAGSIPAIVYGSTENSISLSVDERTFEKVLREAGEATVISLTGIGAPLPVLIHEVDLDPITNRTRHVDFYAITKGEKVEIAIPLAFIGESPAVEDGANLVKVLHEVEVEADPMSLPHAIEVDLSMLVKVDDQIRAKDLTLPTGVSLVTEPEEVVALVQEVVAEEETAAPADISSVEVEKKGKAEDSEGAAGAESVEAKKA